MFEDIKQLKSALEELMSERREKGPSYGNSISTFCVTQAIIRVFQRQYSEDSKKAEKILGDLLLRGDEVIKGLTLFALLGARNEGRILDAKTEIRLYQFKNNPINGETWDKTNATLQTKKEFLQREKAHLN